MIEAFAVSRMRENRLSGLMRRGWETESWQAGLRRCSESYSMATGSLKPPRPPSTLPPQSVSGALCLRWRKGDSDAVRMEASYLWPGPSTYIARPALWMGSVGARIDEPTFLEDGDVLTDMTLMRRDETDCAVAMLEVVPVDKAADPVDGLLDAGKPPLWVAGSILEGAVQRFHERVVVADVWTAEGGKDAEKPR